MNNQRVQPYNSALASVKVSLLVGEWEDGGVREKMKWERWQLQRKSRNCLWRVYRSQQCDITGLVITLVISLCYTSVLAITCELQFFPMLRCVLRRAVLSGQALGKHNNLLALRLTPNVVRFNSGRSSTLDSKINEKVVEQRAKQQSDWTAPKVPYELVKKLSQQPSKV